MRRLSWSQYNKWQTCPYDWYGHYILRLIPFEKNIHFQVGSAAHAAAEACLNSWGSQRKTVPELVSIFSNYLQSDGVTDPDTLQYWTLCGQNMLLGWYGWLSEQDIQVEAVERVIEMQSFKGIIDCIALIDNQRYIIDWKTSSHEYSQEHTNTDGQLTTYVWLDGCHYGTKVAHGVLLKGTSKFQFVESQRLECDVEEFLEGLSKMRSLIATYKTKDDPPKTPGSHCQWCDLYKMGACEGEDDF